MWMELFLDCPYSDSKGPLYRTLRLAKSDLTFGSLGSLWCLVWVCTRQLRIIMMLQNQVDIHVQYIHQPAYLYFVDLVLKHEIWQIAGMKSHCMKLMTRIAFFWRSQVTYFMYVFPHIEIPYRRYWWTRLKYNILRCSQVTIFSHCSWRICH